MIPSDTSTATPDPPGAWVRLVRLVETVVGWLARGALVLSGLATLSVFGMICYSVGMRYFVRAPQPWVDEAAGWVLVAMVMLAIPEVQRRGDHIGIDFLASKLPPGRRPWVIGFGLVMVLVSAVILVIEGVEMVQFTHMIGLLSNQIPDVPLWAVQSMIPIGFALMLLVAAVQLLLVLFGLKPRDMAEALQEEIT